MDLVYLRPLKGASSVELPFSSTRSDNRKAEMVQFFNQKALGKPLATVDELLQSLLATDCGHA